MDILLNPMNSMVQVGKCFMHLKRLLFVVIAFSANMLCCSPKTISRPQDRSQADLTSNEAKSVEQYKEDCVHDISVWAESLVDVGNQTLLIGNVRNDSSIICEVDVEVVISQENDNSAGLFTTSVIVVANQEMPFEILMPVSLTMNEVKGVSISKARRYGNTSMLNVTASVIESRDSKAYGKNAIHKIIVCNKNKEVWTVVLLGEYSDNEKAVELAYGEIYGLKSNQCEETEVYATRLLPEYDGFAVYVRYLSKYMGE